MCAHTCVRNPHTCVRHAHTFCTPHALHASFMLVPFTWESSWLTHVWEAMLLTPLPPLDHVTIKGFSHMCEPFAPFEWSKTLIHVELTWPPPHWSWGILALHLSFNPSRPFHLSSPIKGEPLSSFSQEPHAYCYAAGFVSNHIPWKMKSSITWWFHEVCMCYFSFIYALFFVSCYLTSYFKVCIIM